MLDIEKQFGRLLTLVLLVLFIWRVALSRQMLLDKVVASSVTKQYSKWRLFPSLTICMDLRSAGKKKPMKNINGKLERLVDRAIISFTHWNVSESG